MTIQNAPPDIAAAYALATPKQRALALNLAKGMNRGDAMLAAGYAKSQARKCLKEVIEHPLVMTLAGFYSQQAIKKNELTVERAVEEMASIMLFDPMTIHDEAGNLLPVDKWPETARRAFSGWDSAGKPKFWSKPDAFEKVAKVQSWYAPERHVHTINPLQQLLEEVQGAAMPVVGKDPDHE